MKSYDQIRAETAIKAAEKEAKGKQEGDIAKGLPSLIINNGLLATLAFGKGEDGYETVVGGLRRHLQRPEIKLLPKDKEISDIEQLVKHLSTVDSSTLRLITNETLRWLTFYKRFAKKPAKESA